MLSEPECQVAVGRPGDIELLCVGEHGLVTIGRRVQQQELGSRWPCLRVLSAAYGLLRLS